jgi:hypothetical protein
MLDALGLYVIAIDNGLVVRFSSTGTCVDAQRLIHAGNKNASRPEQPEALTTAIPAPW